MIQLGHFSSHKQAVGVYVSSDNIFLSFCSSGSSGRSDAVQTVSCTTPPGSIEAGFIHNPALIAQALKKIMRDHRIKARHISFAVDFPVLITRAIEMPSLPRHQMLEALRGEVDPYLSGGSAVIDYYPLDQKRLFVTALKREVAQVYLEVSRLAGLDLICLDAFVLTAIRALNREHADLSSDEATLLVLRNDRTFQLGILKKGRLYYLRTLDVQGEEELTREVRLISDYWEEMSGGTSGIKKAIVVDEGHAPRDWVDFLAQQFENIRFERGRSTNEKSDTHGLSRSVSAGLVLRSIRKASTFDVNLVPPEKWKRDRLIRRSFLAFTYLSGLFGIFFFVSLILSGIISSVHAKNRSVILEIDKTAHVLNQIEEIYIEREAARKSILEKQVVLGRAHRLPWADILGDLKRFIPHEVWLSEVVAHDKGRILAVSGYALEREAAYQYVRFLSYSEYFDEPTLERIGSESGEGQAGAKFLIHCPLTDTAFTDGKVSP